MKSLKVISNYFNHLKIIIKFFRINFLKQLFPIPKKKLQTSFFTNNKYYISTERGIFYKTKKSLIKIVNIPCYGLAINDNNLYFSSSDYIYTYIYKFSLIQNKITKLIFKKKIKDHGNRIHELFISNESLYFAATYDDTIGVINLNNIENIKFIKPRDKNINFSHLNSLFVFDKYIFFTAARCLLNGRIGSVLGFLNNGKFKFKKFYNFGIHNILFDGKKIIFNDTFGGDNLPSTFINDKILYSFEKLPKYNFSIKPINFAIRGISIRGSEVLLGSSNKGSRFTRFNKSGYLIHIIDNQVQNVFKTPFSQIYDIILSDGSKIDFENKIDFDTFENLFEKLNFD